MFDYFNSTRKANHILARIAKTAFNSAETKPIVEFQGTSASLASGKIILRLSKLDSTVWKVCAPKKTESSGKKVITLDENFNPSAEKNKEKLAKKRKVDGNNLQVGRTENDGTPCKKRRVLIRKIKSSKKWDVSVICEPKSSVRRSKRLAARSGNKQKIEDSAVTDFNFSAVVSQSTVRRKDQSCLKACPHKSSRRIQSLRSSSNVPS